MHYLKIMHTFNNRMTSQVCFKLEVEHTTSVSLLPCTAVRNIACGVTMVVGLP